MNPLLRLGRKAENALWEWRLGISTRGLHASEITSEEHVYYGTNSYSMTRDVLAALALGPDDVFVDLGSGKGRVICVASRYPLKEVIGVDDDSVLCEEARRNASRMKGRRSPVTIVKARAQDYDYRVGTVFFLFDPFGPKTMGQVLEKMREGIDANPRPVRIAYVLPAQEFVLRHSGWLREYERWTTKTHRFIAHTTSFWVSTR
jgi:Histone methylation protein DOT1